MLSLKSIRSELLSELGMFKLVSFKGISWVGAFQSPPRIVKRAVSRFS